MHIELVIFGNVKTKHAQCGRGRQPFDSGDVIKDYTQPLWAHHSDDEVLPRVPTS